LKFFNVRGDYFISH